MRGSINHQVTVVFNQSGIFRPGESKHKAKIDARVQLRQNNESNTSTNIAGKIAIYSYGTAQKYKDTWHQAGHFIKKNFHLKDITAIEGKHIQAYLEQRITDDIKYSSFQRECAALGKLEQALTLFVQQHGKKYNTEKTNFDFSAAIEEARNIAKETLNRSIKNRGYNNPENIIKNIDKIENKIAARIQLEGGARISEAVYIKKDQLKGYTTDPVTGKKVGKIFLDNTKGGKDREILISEKTYQQLQSWINSKGEFKISKNTYSHNINTVAKQIGERASDTHSLRYCYAQRRYNQYLTNKYTHEQALQGVSWEMGHGRADITLHYLQ